jgi:hypothetical protein
VTTQPATAPATRPTTAPATQPAARGHDVDDANVIYVEAHNQLQGPSPYVARRRPATTRPIDYSSDFILLPTDD